MKRFGYILLLVLAMGYSGTVCAAKKSVQKQLDKMESKGYQLFQDGKYDKSAQQFTKLAERSTQLIAQGEESPGHVRYLVNLGLLLHNLQDYDNSEKYLLQAYDYLRSFDTLDSVSYAACVHNLGLLYSERGHFEQGEKYYQEALAIRQAMFGPEHVDCALTLGNLGSIYLILGNYAEAERCHLESARIYKKLLGENNTNYARTLNNLALLYQSLGNREKAVDYFLRSNAIIKTIQGEESELYIRSLVNIGGAYIRLGKYPEAEETLTQALRVAKRFMDKHHRDYVSILYAFGDLYDNMGKIDLAEQYHLESIELRKQIYGERHLLIGYDYEMLGDIYRWSDLAKADHYYNEALQIKIECLGEQNAQVASTLRSLGSLYFYHFRLDQAAVYYERAHQIVKQDIAQAINFMSEQQLATYWGAFHHAYNDNYPNLAYDYYSEDPHIATFAYNNELFKKGLLLQSSNAVRRSVLESSDDALVVQWNELTALRSELTSERVKELGSEQIRELEGQAEALEKDIARRSAAYRENMRQWSITWDSVRAALKPDQVAIEYMIAPLTDDSTMYCALLLRDTCSMPIMIPLFEEKEVSSLLHKSTNNRPDISRTYAYDERGGKLAQLVWSPILPYLKDGDAVFFSPAGVLHQLAIENLPFDASSSMAEHYDLHRLSSTRELASQESRVKRQESSAALYGGITYGSNVRALPGTAVEVDSIAAILTKHDIRVTVYTKDSANEASVKALSGQKQNMLHFATHGFFRPDNGSGIDPLERSGLVFAGVEVMTAKEISLLDLRGADIVVLSACETGLGDISGEGVFGLQRAFKMAGARTILMALWQVNDEATRMLMTAFYRHYTAGETKREAFRNAQQEVRSSKYKSPYFWAGFILLD